MAVISLPLPSPSLTSPCWGQVASDSSLFKVADYSNYGKIKVFIRMRPFLARSSISSRFVLLRQDQEFHRSSFFSDEIEGLKPFFWVVRTDSVNGLPAKFPENFMSRVGERAKIIEWAPQVRVLAHPSIACFISHCGWNSTMEGISMGVPFLCWPYIADQFHNRNYICDAWRIGLNLDEDENGVITGHEISRKVNSLLSSTTIKENVLRLKGAARASVAEGGSSFKNFQTFIATIKHHQ